MAFTVPSEAAQFLQANASAIFGLIGALGGGILSFFATGLLKRREFNLQLWAKLLERRIAAHENVIAVAVEMRVMVALGGVNAKSEVRRAPQVLISKEEFERWFTRFTQLTLEGTTWLSTATKREVNLAQDYLVTLHLHLQAISTDRYLEVGELVRQDFIDLSSSLEKVAYDYFQSGVRKLRLDSLEAHHKYKRPETERRLKATALLSNMPAIHALREAMR